MVLDRVLRIFLAVALIWTGLAFAAPAARAAEVELLPMRQVGGTGHAGLYGWGAATARDGSVYIGDYWNQRIQHYAKDGTLLGTVVPERQEGAAPHQPPYGIAVDPRNGDIYFGDVDSDATVDKYDQDGNFLLEFGGKGDGLGLFQYPSRVAVAPDGKVIVSDSRAEKLSVWDDSGNPLFEKQGQSWGTPTLGRPRGLALDGSGTLFVADALLQQVQVFQFNDTFTDFTYVRSIGRPKDAPGEPDPGELGLDLRGVAVDDTRDALYVVDADTGYVAKFRKSTGAFLQYFGGNGTKIDQFSGGGRDVTVDGDGNVWVGDMPNFRAVKFSPNGAFLQQIPDPVVLPPEGGFNQPRGASVDADGNVFVADTHNWRIQKFDAQGNFVTQWGSRGHGDSQFNYPKGLDVNRATGEVAVADTDGNAVKLYDNDGQFLCSIDKYGQDPGEFAGLLTLDFGPDGRIYVADTQNGRIQVLEKVAAPGGCDLRVRSTNGVIGGKGTDVGRFQATNGIAVDTDGTLWVTDRLLGRVTHLTNSGSVLATFGGGVGAEPTQFERASDIAVDDRYVYISDADRDLIKIWRKDGTFVREWGGPGRELGKLQRPHGLDIDADGRLYVTEQSSERVQVLDIALDVDPESVDPSGAVTVPQANAALPQGPLTLTGTASDDSGLATVLVGIRDRDNDVWWNGFDWQSEFSWQSATLSDSGLGATSVTWEYAWTPPSVGNYGVQIRAQDVWGNADTTVPFVSFSTFDAASDVVGPTVSVVSPGAGESLPLGVVPVSGSGADDVGVVGAQVAIKDVDGNRWWSGSSWVSGFAWVDASVAVPGALETSWSYGFDPGFAGRFGLMARTVDAAGNTSASSAWRGFSTFDAASDVVGPMVSVVSPGAGESLPLGVVPVSGSGADDVGVVGAQVAIKDVDGNRWWSGSSWVSGFAWVDASVAVPGALETSWSYGFDPGFAGRFGLMARTVDAAGNTSASSAWRGFSTFDAASDVVGPMVSVVSPGAGESLPLGVVPVSGSGADDVGVVGAQVAIKDVDGNRWWSGSSWVSGFAWVDASVAVPGALETSWSYGFDPGFAGRFGLMARTVDAAGNTSASSAWRGFTVVQ